jgi:glycosyltransferase involved in cell wall biosynthesis
LLSTWDTVVRGRGADAPRLVIGGDGPLASSVIKAAQHNPKLEYAGVVGGETKQLLIAGCRALIAPSIWREPLGLVVYEAFDHARPVLAARSGGLTELVQPGKTGYLHAPGDSLELAGQVLELEREPGLREKLGQAAREWLLANTSHDEWRRQFFEIVDHARGSA